MVLHLTFFKIRNDIGSPFEFSYFYRLKLKNEMKRALQLILAFILIITGCQEKLLQETTTAWPDGSPQKVSFYRVSGGKKEKVKEIRYYQGGNKEMEGEFADGRKDGAWTSWFESGKKQSEGFFKNDMRNGKAVVYRENGFKYYEGTYSLGKLHGTWITYDTDGSRLKETLYEYDRKVKEVDFR
jgi:antitoxin component YwqK of YwqJK toxin-antitoxin module